MKVEGKKIVTLNDDERAILRRAEGILDELSEHLGNEEHFDFADISESIHYILHTAHFETDYAQE